MSRGRIIAAVVTLVVIALVVVAVLASAQARVPQVTTAPVTRSDLAQTVTASGQLEGDVKADIFPPTQDTLKSIEVIDGQEVRAGQVLATLDRAPLDVAVAQARAGLAQAQAGLVSAQRSAPSSTDRAAANAAVAAAQASVTSADEQLDAAQAQLTAAQAQLSVARSTPSTLPPAARDAQLDQLAAAVEQADAGVAAARAGQKQAASGLASAKQGRAKLQSQSSAITAAASAVDSAETGLAQAVATRDKAALTSPIDGVVVFAGGGSAASLGAVKPAPGGAVSPAAAPFTVFQLGALNFNAQVDEADIAGVKPGMKGIVTLDAFPGVNFDTTVAQVKTQAISTSTGGTAFPVLLPLKDTGKRLLVGMGGNVDIQTSNIAGTVTVPVEALFEESGGTYVYVVDAKDVVHRTLVKTGAMTDTRAQITSGVVPGQRVALGGLSNLKDGQTVRVK